MHALIICRDMGAGTPEGHQIHGFQMYREDLKEKLDFTFNLVQAMTLDAVEEAVATHPADLVVLMISWAEPVEKSTALMRRLYESAPRPQLILLDYSAQTSSEYFHLLPYVDRFVKRQVLRDRSIYQQPLEKLFVVTDFLSKKMNFSLEGWETKNSIPDPAHINKIVDAWNLGVTPTYRKLVALSRHARAAWRLRPFEVNRRIGLVKASKQDEWYQRYRGLSLDAMAPLERSHRCTGTARISSKRYTLEMLLSKIVVSPFGWGELCFRDYQAVATGALLIKPSMSHLKTSPDIFIEYETYVPLEWDFSDLQEKCEHYLRNPRESMKIIRNAQEVLHDYYERHGFVKDVQRCFDINPPASSNDHPSLRISSKATAN